MLKNANNKTIITLSAIIGITVGIGIYTFAYAKGYTYFSDNPQACNNCHIMNEQYDGWIKSSHRSVATCNDCHTPEGLSKYKTKASNGFWHSFYFTTGWHPDNIQITENNFKITESSCKKCHQAITESIDQNHSDDNNIKCLSCHRSVGHMH